MADTEVLPNVPVVEGTAGGAVAETLACQAGICGGFHYDTAALNDIHRVALDRFLAIPRGGLEVGGLLFGRVKSDVVEILATEDFPIEYLSGPSFVLSQRDEAALAERLQGNAPEIEGAPLEIVGWWHSHTRTDIDLTLEDIQVHRKYFPQPNRVALIIKPFKFDPSQVAVYRPGGGAHGNVACAVFSVGKGALRKPAAPLVSEIAVSDPAPTTPVTMPSSRAPVTRRSARPWLMAAGAIASLVISLLAWRFSSSPKQQTSVVPAEPVHVSLTGTGNELTIRWDGTSNMLSSAQSAELIIVDGPDTTRIPLAVDSLRSATLSYARRTSKVEVRFRARSLNNELIEAAAHYVGPAPVIANTADPAVEQMKAELDRVNGELMRMRTAEAPKQTVTPQTISLPPSPVTASFVPRTPLKLAAVPQVSSAQPTYVPPPAIATGGIAPAPPKIPIQTSAPVAPEPVVRRLPSSGRAIWTGLLPPGGILLFDGRRPSSGAITGRMPQRPSRVRVFSADLTEAGIVVYTDGSKQQVEPPGAANGWNLTTYRADGKRSRDVTVVEAPAPSNNWQKLMVRSDQRRVSMLVVEWEELP